MKFDIVHIQIVTAVFSSFWLMTRSTTNPFSVSQRIFPGSVRHLTIHAGYLIEFEQNVHWRFDVKSWDFRKFKISIFYRFILNSLCLSPPCSHWVRYWNKKYFLPRLFSFRVSNLLSVLRQHRELTTNLVKCIKK